MIKRVVRMSFHPERVDDFLKMFEEIKEKIRGQEGCLRLELLQDIHEQHVFFTYSFWENETALNAYRHTDLFAEVWKKTKSKFNDKPMAWSLESKIEIE